MDEQYFQLFYYNIKCKFQNNNRIHEILSARKEIDDIVDVSMDALYRDDSSNFLHTDFELQKREYMLKLYNIRLLIAYDLTNGPLRTVGEITSRALDLGEIIQEKLRLFIDKKYKPVVELDIIDHRLVTQREKMDIKYV